MQPKLSSILLSVLGISQVPLATAFQITFYSGGSCTGSRQGGGYYVYNGDPRVCYNIPGNAISATITKEDTRDAGNHNVAFYRQGECNEGMGVERKSERCVSFSGARSFNIREG